LSPIFSVLRIRLILFHCSPVQDPFLNVMQAACRFAQRCICPLVHEVGPGTCLRFHPRCRMGEHGAGSPYP
jgi:hypothetical protein